MGATDAEIVATTGHTGADVKRILGIYRAISSTQNVNATAKMNASWVADIKLG
jgi:hypothetical protein